MMSIAGTDDCEKLSRREIRRRAMLDAANELFLEKGYGATSLTDIVKRSGGSLATLYELFGGKEGLFRSMIEEGCIEFFSFLHEVDTKQTPQDLLRAVAQPFVEGVLADEGAFIRLVVSEAGQFPEIGRVFYSAGPANAVRIIGNYLAGQVARGVFHIDDTETAADTFVSMLLYDLQMRLLCRVPVKPTRRQIEKHVDQVVKNFLTLYGPADRAPARRSSKSPASPAKR
jgi:AcrR family transcriptional regulator